MAFCVLTNYMNTSITCSCCVLYHNKVNKYLCSYLYVISVKNEMDIIVHSYMLIAAKKSSVDNLTWP